MAYTERKTPRLSLPIWAGPFFLLLILFLAGGCSGAVRPKVLPAEALKVEKIGPEVKRLLNNGDWLVIRGLTGPDQVVATATNMPFSHAAIYDRARKSVIEADGSGVHLTSLDDFLAKAQRLMIIRPYWATPETAEQAVARAESLLGRGYNYSGLIGLGSPGRYYCTQLAVHVYEPFMDKKPNPIPRVIAPGQMHHWGRIIYDSGP